MGVRARWSFLLAVALAAASTISAEAAENGGWIGTWAASAQPVWSGDFFAPPKVPANLFDQTVRELATVSIGGARLRVRLSNEYGTRPLVVSAAHVAVRDKASAIVAGTDRALTFAGKSSFTIPPGAPAISDPVDLAVGPLSTLAISLFFAEVTPPTTMHWDGHQTAYVAAGNHVADTDFKADSTMTAKVFLSEIMVDAQPGARAIVMFGDSITDGDGSTLDADKRWPDLLARRLKERQGPPVAVINQGISGARILKDRMGVNALARFDRDVLLQLHADTVVLMMGINDIGWPQSLLAPDEKIPAAADVIAGYEQLIERAHLHGLRIFGATLTPFEDTFHGTPLFGYYSPEKDKVREEVNAFIRTGGKFDGVIDFDAVVRDPARPAHVKAEFDAGDHLHPSDAGYVAMADSIDLDKLLGNR
jgi:lysophospholipase L1-like esterase